LIRALHKLPKRQEKTMQENMMNSFSDYGKSAVVASKDLLEINSKLMGKLLEAQISLANLYVESSEKQLEAVKTFSEPKEYLTKQTALVEEFAAKLSETAQANVKLAQETGEEYKLWLEKGVKAADAAVVEATEQAKKQLSPVVPAKKPAAKKTTKSPATKAATAKAEA
jgi:hypothetical protein